MTIALIFKAQAQQDIIDAAKWYETQRSGLGEEFLHAVLKESDHIRVYPFAYPKKYKDIRELVMKKFPYLILYRIEEDLVYVHAIFNSHQNPGKKRTQ